MICDVRTCAGCPYLENEQDDWVSITEFLVNCQHAKCKVVRLVRQQINKLQNAQYKRHSSTNDMYSEAYEEMHENEILKPQETLSNEDDKLQEIPSNEDDEVHDEIYRESMYDNEPYKMQGKTQQTHNETFEEQKTIAVARRAVETKNIIENAVTSWYLSTSSGITRVERNWILRILNRVRDRAHLILAAVIIGVVAWSALVYGVFLGATACGSSRTCFASFFKYTDDKRSVF